MVEQNKKYATARAFRTALKDKVKQICLADISQRPEDVYRKLAFDRFLTRFNYDIWTLKGGYSLERRLPNIRSTKDIDLAATDIQLLLQDKEEQANLLVNAIQKQIREAQINDYFAFDIRKQKLLPGFGKGGVRCLVTASINQEVISRFQLDVVVQDKCLLPRESVTGSDLLAFADLETPIFLASAREEVFAEKVHAFTKPREEENTRVRDIIDLYRLVEAGLDARKANIALVGVFTVRAEHLLPDTLPAPPSSWKPIFAEFVANNDLAVSLQEAFDRVDSFYKTVRSL